MQRQQFRLRGMRVPLLRPRPRDQDRGDLREMRLQVHQLLLREMQDVQADRKDVRVQLRIMGGFGIIGGDV